MSGTPINLNKARKARAKADAARQADANRARHGLSKAEREAAKAVQAKQARIVDGHKRET